MNIDKWNVSSRRAVVNCQSCQWRCHFWATSEAHHPTCHPVPVLDKRRKKSEKKSYIVFHEYTMIFSHKFASGNIVRI